MLDIGIIQLISWLYLGLVSVSIYTNKDDKNQSWLSFSVFIGAFVFHFLSYTFQGTGAHWFGLVLTINLITIILISLKDHILRAGRDYKPGELFTTTQDKIIVGIFLFSSLNNVINMVLKFRFDYYGFVPVFNAMEIGSCFLIAGVLLLGKSLSRSWLK